MSLARLLVKVIRFSALMALAFICGLASAQSYAIRVAYNTNLRSAPSLDAAVAATAPAGSTWQVSGEFNRWLKISHQSGDVWMAGWVSHSRVAGVETSAQPPSPQQSAAPVDNCCFVDRQCDSEQDWQAGYWAFQKDQCAAPVQRQSGASSQVPAQSSGAAPANIDNCCFIGWRCQSDDDWANGYQAYQSNQCKHPGLAIEGSPGFVLQMEQALDMLRAGSAHWYNYVLGGLDKIVQDLSNDVPGVHLGARTFHLDYVDQPPDGVSYDVHTTHNAAMLVHEACHVYRYEAGLESGGLAGETACVQTEIQALQAVNPDSSWISFAQTVLANIHRPECQWWWGEYKACG